MNILDKYRLPLFAPETEAGAPEPDAGGAPPPGDTGGEKLSIRESLERGFKEDREAEAARERDEKGKYKAKDAPKTKAAKRPVDEMREAVAGESEETPPAQAEGAEAAPAEGAEVAPKVEIPAPTAWTKEAKEAWAALPPAVQAAVTKRETDVQKGVDELKAKYADLDTALAPHIPVIRQFGHTPAQAVGQMFEWFKQLSLRPDQAFPALAKSFNYEFKAPAAAPVTALPAGDAAAPQPGGEVPPAVQKYIDELKGQLDGIKKEFSQQLGGLQNTVASRQQADTQQVLSNWAKDKPHYEKVRVLMSQLLMPNPQTGQSVIPLKDGSVDLDNAYFSAIKLHPEVWAEVQQEEQKKKDDAAKAAAEAKKKAEAEATAKAKAASASLTPGAPGNNSAAGGAKPKKGKSVKESLAEAIDELRAS